ncbi:MAG TPA: zinc dependent phospholipase C family protein [Dehalococcoidia bacterium]|nr:zinc dependent phospholipase C family protein [Dehalococcoidia bacterium]
MPPPVLHMSLAKTIADGLRLAEIEADRGAYYLGSTAPDIRAVTRWERERTHFFDLNNFGHQDSVAAMFAAFPELADRAKVSAATASFLAGYITHLVLDEGWISEVYRPLFGERSVLAGSERANVMDRVIQFEMDRRQREDRETIEAMKADIAATALEVTVGFIDIDTLRRWREVNLDFLRAPPTWERFRNVASRHLSAYGVTEPEHLEAFMAEVPSILQETVDHVGWDRVQAYLDGALARARDQLRGYLQ